MFWTIIVTLVGGLVIGLLGKAVAPGDRDHIPLWLTVICGIVGMILGSLVYWWLFGGNGRFDGHEPTSGQRHQRHRLVATRLADRSRRGRRDGGCRSHRPQQDPGLTVPSRLSAQVVAPVTTWAVDLLRRRGSARPSAGRGSPSVG